MNSITYNWQNERWEDDVGFDFCEMSPEGDSLIFEKEFSSWEDFYFWMDEDEKI